MSVMASCGYQSHSAFSQKTESTKIEARIDDDRQQDCSFVFSQKITVRVLGAAWVEMMTAWKVFGEGDRCR